MMNKLALDLEQLCRAFGAYLALIDQGSANR
jgi:hypothetical protein